MGNVSIAVFATNRTQTWHLHFQQSGWYRPFYGENAGILEEGWFLLSINFYDQDENVYMYII